VLPLTGLSHADNVKKLDLGLLLGLVGPIFLMKLEIHGIEDSFFYISSQYFLRLNQD
jgi:hypothetical protein